MGSRPLTGAWVGTTRRRSATSWASRRALSRARGLERQGRRGRREGIGRALSRARGLKLRPLRLGGLARQVAPSHGRVGWNHLPPAKSWATPCRALSRARGLERADARALRRDQQSRPHTGAWIGTAFRPPRRRQPHSSRPLAGALKQRIHRRRLG